MFDTNTNTNFTYIRLEVKKSLLAYNLVRIINYIPEHLPTPQSTKTLLVRYKDFVMIKYNLLV